MQAERGDEADRLLLFGEYPQVFNNLWWAVFFLTLKKLLTV